MIRSGGLLGLVLVAGCATAATTPSQQTTPTATAADPLADSVAAWPMTVAPVASPAAAFRSGWMPLDATGVAALRRVEPEQDGRGVLIAILDSGVDPGVAGLQTTSHGRRKILDLRDFSGEGRIELAPLDSDGAVVEVAGQRLTGMSRVRSFIAGRLLAGAIVELDLGPAFLADSTVPQAAHLDGNGSTSDTLPLIVGRTVQGWAVFADTDRDGSLADERPVHDYRTAPETFAWHQPGRPSPMNVAVNFSQHSGEPELTLVFDNSGHGTHVAGIAAGHDLYGVAGFDGVAPGAYLLGIKIADNSRGGVSASDAMRRGMGYAIEFAERRNLPLVINLSFGVGNALEGTAVIDSIVDSILTAHPSVVMTTSAGNDGPGLSTVGFPGSAARAVTVGATFPVLFLRQPATSADLPDPVAFFSARGGPGLRAKPDLVAPGIAYSTVPFWHRGAERNGGTSMASPHVAGLAAIVISEGSQRNVRYPAERIKALLRQASRPIVHATALDDGAGQPDIRLALAMARGTHDESSPAAIPDRFPPDDTPIARDSVFVPPETIPAGAVSRVFFEVLPGQPFTVTAATGGPAEPALTSLHLPGGQPAPGPNGLTASAGPAAAKYRVDARDVRPGIYQLTAAASPVAPATTGFAINRSAVTMTLQVEDTAVTVGLTNLESAETAGSVALVEIGRERQLALEPAAAGRIVTPVSIPAWASLMELDLELPQEQWGLFTDFGLTIIDSLGRVVEGRPANYPWERISLPLTEDHRGRGFLVEILPGLARGEQWADWRGVLRLRFYRQPVADGERRTFRLGPGEAGSITFRAGGPLEDSSADGGRRLFRATLMLDGSTENWTIEGS